MKSLTQRISALLIAFVLLFSGTFPSLAGFPRQELDPRVGAHANALRTIARYASQSGQVDNLLSSFQISVADKEAWKSFPAVRKLEAVYLSAQQTGQGNGQRFLALLSKSLSQQYASVRAEPTLEPFLKSASLPHGTKLTISAEKVVVSTLNASTKEAILTIAKYAEGNALGGTTGILTDYYGLSHEKAYEILRTSENPVQALSRGLAEKPSASHASYVESIVTDLDKTYQAARSESTFEPYRNKGSKKKFWISEPPLNSFPKGNGDDWKPRPTFEVPNPPPVNPPFPRGGRSGRYFEFSRSVYEGPGSVNPSFGTMTSSPRGWGGVVLGNSVSDISSPGKLTSLAWISDAGNKSSGRLELRYRTNANQLVTRAFGPLYAQDVAVAMELVRPTTTGATIPKNGDGIGLVGLDTTNPTPANNPTKGSANFFPVLMHPALLDTRLGWSGLLCDSLPIEQFQLVRDARKDGSTSSAQVLTWLMSASDTWKFIDCPMALVHTNGRIVVRATKNGVFKIPVDGRDCYLTVKAFREGTATDTGDNDPFVVKFEKMLPNLLQFSPDYALLNRLASVCAVVRYAKEKGASFVNRPKIARNVETPRSLGIKGGGGFISIY